NAKNYLFSKNEKFDFSNLCVLSAKGLDPQAFENALQPTLFGSTEPIFLKDIQDAAEPLQDKIFHFLNDSESNIVAFFQHSGIRKGTKLLKEIKAASSFAAEPKAIKTDRDRINFVKTFFVKNNFSVSADAIQVLVNAFGEDIDELYSICKQFINDFDSNKITAADINKYFAGRTQIKIFEISEAVSAGDIKTALNLYQNGIFTGLEPISVVAVIAMQLRKIAKVAAVVKRTIKADDLKMAPWQIAQTKKYLPLWSTKTLSKSFYDLARTEELLKTNSKIDKNYLVEQLIINICSQAKNNQAYLPF
ncbi:MAG: hypothetical protein LBB07_02380, partial [Bifidobacteriaceae bacterium]|nr:hypothetical protein [Bifidobacteriaceae bacterium]